jgi:hypothetical protein
VVRLSLQARRLLLPGLLEVDRGRAVLLLGVGAVSGAAIAVAPLAATVALTVIAALAVLLTLGRWGSSRLFLGALGLLLVAYAFLNKGGAYLGVPPLFVGEVVLSLGLVSLLLNVNRLRLGVVEVLLLAFMVLGLLRTIPFIGWAGLDALRDGVAWGYALFAFAVLAAIRTVDVPRVVQAYRTVIPWFLAWLPVAAVLNYPLDFLLPRLPGPLGGVVIVEFNHGHIGVQLAGIAAFVLVGLWSSSSMRSWLGTWGIWLLWLPNVALVGALNRGSMLAASMAASVILFVRPSVRWMQPVVVMIFLLASIGLVNPTIDLGADRKLSLGQLSQNITSVFGRVRNDNLEGTARWRLLWWDDIVDYTVGGPYFWGGKGFGINLADDDGYQVTEDGSLRAPHNSHIEILARMGVPGLTLWILVQAAFGLALVRSGLRARALGMAFWVRAHAVVFAFWLAALVNTTFDPYLQGPHGGIWFWSMFGLGLALTRAVREIENGLPDPAVEAAATALPAVSVLRPARSRAHESAR